MFSTSIAERSVLENWIWASSHTNWVSWEFRMKMFWEHPDKRNLMD